ncbi:phosphopantothenate-cysteine ligase /phosphopantothenoylcysteine decarboxylase [Melghiribacillus thermohalophilus]|uniref:Coenzyme A biosynthesis bifunctional protein CoaBC n=1 Tax=Melghiribacillus thermohalophilus TaxID=1324956 RepID=A0A4R3ND24_9BACI|nr:bifunctional phosphopantothenoylcysteine decarboxylase/phosphopantothenate--cysteine ligase CoaBC [Melghiribacillus thermohalophilus]TCT26826.1 phosphopantothenate-cysteine ligase /phosphopantothenoylcysteine decarboxylase [Melghiribacillus thermohalophilus]
MRGKKILLGVSGGIAAYKACALTSKLTQKGAIVKVIMTESAREFVQPLTFQALSRQPVYTDTFDEKDPKKIAHIDLADWADLAILAPATANMIGKLANGIADDILSTTLLASRSPVYVAPAMNVHMYDHPAVQQNMKTLESFGFKFIEPGDGYLACGYVGKGRLEEPETIIDVIEKQETKTSFFKGKNIIITGGPTREALDPVRFFTNHSSGKMGYALAQAAQQLGGKVTFISGPTSLGCPAGVNCVEVTSAEEMYEAVLSGFKDADLVIKAAAVADYRPKKVYDHKIKKQMAPLIIEMERTKDIMAELGKRKTHQFLVGFAAETDKPIEHGKEKLKKKNMDAIVVNDLTKDGAGFGEDTNIVTYINQKGLEVSLPRLSKLDIAYKLFELMEQDMKDDQP